MKNCTPLLLLILLWLTQAGRALADTYPTTLAELDRWYIEPPPGSNAAPFILQAYAAYQDKETEYALSASTNLPLFGQAKLPESNEPIPAAMKAAIAEFTTRNHEMVTLLDPILTRPQSRYPIDLKNGINTLLTHLAYTKRLANLLTLVAVQEAEASRGREAAQAVLKILALARSLEQEPLTISQLVRAALIASANRALAQTLNRTTLPAASLAQLANALDSLEASEAVGTGLIRSLIFEKISVAEFFKPTRVEIDGREEYIGVWALTLDTPSPSEASQIKAAFEEEMKSPERKLADQQFYEATIARAADYASQPFPERFKVSEILQTRTREARLSKLSVSGKMPESLSKMITKMCVSLAQLRLQRTAIALAQFHTDTGVYPSYLSGLTPKYLPAQPKNPFVAGNRLQYQATTKGYELKCSGAHRLDGYSLKAFEALQRSLTFTIEAKAK